MRIPNGHKHLPPINVGEAVRLFGLTPRAVRHYEIEGLVEATRDHRHNRIFDGTARLRLQWISVLRGVGVPIPDIRSVLEAEDDSTQRMMAARVLEIRRQMIQAHLQRIEEGIATLREDKPPAWADRS